MNIIDTRRLNETQRMLNLFSRYSPHMPLGEAMAEACRAGDSSAREAKLSLALIALAKDAGMTDNGSIAEGCTTQKTAWAIKVASHEHASWACGPGDGLEKLKEELDEQS